MLMGANYTIASVPASLQCQAQAQANGGTTALQRGIDEIGKSVDLEPPLQQPTRIFRHHQAETGLQSHTRALRQGATILAPFPPSKQQITTDEGMDRAAAIAEQQRRLGTTTPQSGDVVAPSVVPVEVAGADGEATGQGVTHAGAELDLWEGKSKLVAGVIILILMGGCKNDDDRCDTA